MPIVCNTFQPPRCGSHKHQTVLDGKANVIGEVFLIERVDERERERETETETETYRERGRESGKERERERDREREGE